MAVVMRMSWPTVTPELYERVREIVQWEANPAPGGLFHVAFFDEQGLNVVDVWETPEHFETFVNERLMPGVAEAGGVEAEPMVAITPAHAVFFPVQVTAA